ncbi:hypothetical protein EMPS_04573 [Entomortierella parvispora]|uniref:Peroxisomal biogenesis factor 11 n=1 Tax=Entomortierella parvispora TaxID=205924 RepID=A0A9P3H8Q0_9FUNG|nr:hypothetical protein EMPS_04573 [Entomortierella parvispora]
MEPTPSSPVDARVRARTTSFSATTAVVHSLEHNNVSNSQQQVMDPHQMYPWPSERAKAAAEAAMSPPVSPKQHAIAAGQVEFVEPLQESNNVHNRHEPWVSTNDDNNTSSEGDVHSSPYTHLHRSRTLTHDSAINESRPASLTSSSSYTSANSASVASSAASSSTSLSSAAMSTYSPASSPLSEATVSSAVDALKSSGHLSPSATSGLQRLEIEKTEMFLIDTPPSSHVTSPSSPSSKNALISVSEKTLVQKQPTQPTPASVSTTAHKTSKSTTQIIREISDLVDGRDKTIKVVQYFAKVFLWLFLSNTKQYKVLAGRVKALAKQFSTTRKVLRLGHFVDPLSTVLTLAATLSMNYQKKGSLAALMRKPRNQTWRDTARDRLGMLNSVLGFCQDISDDIYCLGVIGVLDRSFSDKAEPWSNRLWMVGVSIDLHENLQSIIDVRRQIKTLRMTKEISEEKEQARCAKLVQLSNKLHWLQVTTVKLGGDFLFCGYDNLHCSFSDGFQAVTGLASGIAGAYKFVGKIMES